MFGYVKTCTPQLRLCEWEAYRGIYCGLCRTLGRRFGPLARLTLSYDFTFYATLEMALREEVPEFRRRSCGVNPLRRCRHCEENEALNRAADMAILSLWYKAEDTIADGGFLGRCGGRLLRAMLRRQYRRVAEKTPTVDAVFAGEMDRQRALEAAGDTNLDELCEPTAKMTAAMLSLLSEEPGERRVLERLGYLLGRYIYMADALDDWEKDKKHGDFNPFLQCEDEPEALKRHARASLLLTIGEMGAALDLLEADRTALRAGMEQAEAALHTAQQNYAAAKAAVDALQTQQATAETAKWQEQKQHPGKLTQKRACAGDLSSAPEGG